MSPASLTKKLCAACHNTDEALGFQTKHIYDRSLQAGGAMDILLGNIDADTIRLIGRWRSEEMMHCPHIIARHLMKGHVTTTVAAGYHTLIPEAIFLPSYVDTTLG